MDIGNIAITGVSGRFPNTKNVEELKKALLEGTDLITDNHDRWPYESLGTPKSMGVVNDFDKFDATFFEVNPKTANLCDPRGRKLLEVVYESIVDAGINPCDLKGSSTGVFVAVMQNSLDYNYLNIGSGINSSSYIIANNISYTFDFHGPSCSIDTGCSSSIYAIKQAVDNLLLGSCDAAVVCSAHANLIPYDSVEFAKLGVLNPEGRCKTFDDDRKGYVKSEAVVAIFLQKQQHARRIYATILGVGCNVDGYKEDGLIHPSSQSQISLMKDVYQRYAINSKDVVYVDCHGTGTLVGDIEECQALAEYFTIPERNNPLKIGSVKTNVGHTEAAGGLVSLVKILIAIQTEIIPAILHLKTPAIDIPSLTNGELMVVCSNTPYNGGLMAINSFGLGGANGHLVVKPYTKRECIELINMSYRLVQVSGRTEEAVEKLLNKIEESKNNIGFLELIDNIFSTETKNHNYRGYAILNSKTRCVSKYKIKKRPIWFTYSGMGSQWPGMGRELMNFEVFRTTIKRCANAVTQYGLDLEDIIINGTANAFEDPISCFTSILAVSVGLTDLLFSLGIKPDGIIGHSLGEIGCAYGDGLITVEQATLVAYGRGWATKNTELIPGLMASVGLSALECKKLLPEDIFIACDNSVNNVTISGPEASIKLFVEKLHGEGIFVKIVETANIAFHSKYVKDVGPKLFEFLKNVLPEPKQRKLWLPSAIRNSECDSDLGKYNSAKYQLHNFLNKVLYNQVLKRVPKDAIFIEIAPCGLLQPIFKRALSPCITRLHLVQKLYNNNQEFLLDCIGKLYVAGGQPILKDFYIKSEHPVGPETPMISPLVTWNHAYTWNIPKYDGNNYFGKKIEININSKEYKFLLGHVTNGINIFPAAGYIILVWQTFATMLGMHFENTPVVIKRVKLLKCPHLYKNDPIIFTVNILKSGTFEISKEEGLLATGNIYLPKAVEDEFSHYDLYAKQKIYSNIKLNNEDVYKILRLRGYDYESTFRCIDEMDCTDKSAKIRWSKNWISFLDSIFQAITIMEHSVLVVPTEITEIVINPVVIKQCFTECKAIILNHGNFQKTSYCPGLEIKNVTWSNTFRKKKNATPYKFKYQFIANLSTNFSESLQFDEIVQIVIQIVIENNVSSPTVRVAEILDRNTSEIYKTNIKNIAPSTCLKYLEYSVINNISHLTNTQYNLIIVRSLEANKEILNYMRNIDDTTFILSELSSDNLSPLFGDSSFDAVFQKTLLNNSFTLFKKTCQTKDTYTVMELLENDIFNSITNIKAAVDNGSTRILLVDQNNHFDVNELYRYIETEYISKVRMFCIKDINADTFTVDSTFYEQQIRKDIAVNVLKNNKWGTYRYLPIEESTTMKRVDSCFLSIVNNRLQWTQQNLNGFEKNKVNVHYSTIDYWDRYNPNQQNSNKISMGMEYSGVNSSGIRVMGISPRGSLTTHLVPHRYLTWVIPREWSLQEAAAIPFSHTMSYYGLFVKGNLQTHNTILITYNAYSTELAATNFVYNTQCTIFVGVKSPKYIKYLARCFPKLKYNIIDFSKNSTLERIMKRTNGQGVDIIFNTGDSFILKVALDILKCGGKVINIEFNEMLESDVADALIDKDCVFYNITLEKLLNENDYVLEAIRISIQEYIRIGAIKPFFSKTIDMSQLNSLFEYVNNSSQNGKLAVKIHREDQILSRKNKKYFIAEPKTYFQIEKCYLIISELDDFDIEVIKWLSKKGVRKFVISSAKRMTNGYQMYSLDKLKKRENTIIINYSDITCIKNVEELIEQASGVGNIGGIFCFSMTVKDKPLQSNNAIYQKKFKSIKNIDMISRRTCKYLDYFVVFVSQHLGRGYKNEATDLGHANTLLKNLCENRRENNFPALVIEWGPIENIQSTSQVKTQSKTLKILPQSIESCLDTLDLFLQQDHAIVSSTVLDSNEDVKGMGNLSVIDSVAKIFGIKNVDQVDFAAPLINLGMDSIMNFELKNLLCSQFNVDFSVNEIRKLTMEDIKKLEEDLVKL